MKKGRKNFITNYWSHSTIWLTIAVYIAIVLIIITTFGAIYSFIDNSIQFNDCSSINPERKSENYYYFSSVTFYSLGYGDICPVIKSARVFSQVEVAVGAIINAIFLGFIFWKVVGAHLRS